MAGLCQAEVFSFSASFDLRYLPAPDAVLRSLENDNDTMGVVTLPNYSVSGTVPCCFFMSLVLLHL